MILSKLWLSLDESVLNLSFKLRELWFCHQDISGRIDLEVTKWEEHSWEKEDEAAQALTSMKNRKRKMKRLFFSPQFDCFACNALISLIDNWFRSSFLFVFFHFLCFVPFFCLVAENEGKFVSLMGLDATKIDAKKGKMKEVPSTHTCCSRNLFARNQSKSRHIFDLPTFYRQSNHKPIQFWLIQIIKG